MLLMAACLILCVILLLMFFFCVVPEVFVLREMHFAVLVVNTVTVASS